MATRVAIAGAIAWTTAACSGQVAGTSTDGGVTDAVGFEQEAGFHPEGGLPHYDGGGGPHDAGPTPTGDTCQTPGVQCVQPPSPPSGAAPTQFTTAHDYAVFRLYMGDTDRIGVISESAWKAYGYDLDGLVTTKTSTDVCTLAAGASKLTQADGNGGIDNSFGENILPILITVAGSDFGKRIDTAIQGGLSTNLIYAVGFDDAAGNTTTATGLTGVLLGGGNYPASHGGGVPSWDLSTHWPIRPETLIGCAASVGCPPGTDPIANAQVQFPHAYQARGTFVNGSPATLVPILLGLGNVTMPLLIHSATITFDPAAPGSVTNGTIAGVLDTQELVNGFQAVAGSISTSLCSGSAFQSVAQQIEQASDIVIDPSTGAVSNSAGTLCNAVSIGLGFDALEIAAPTAADVAGPTPVPPNPCGDI
jgi:hypothetical protein